MADLINNNIPEEEEVLIIELEDMDGNLVEYEYLDTIEYEDDEYIVLVENTENADEVIILKIESEDDETENYIGIDDEELFDKLYEIFKESHADEFDFKN